MNKSNHSDFDQLGGVLKLAESFAFDEDLLTEGKIELKTQGVDVFAWEKDDSIVLSKIVVPKESRGSGIGTKAMNELIAYADKVNKPIVLTPSGDFGGSVAKLKEFYTRLGFVPNSGKSKDYRFNETYIKLPDSISESKHIFSADEVEKKLNGQYKIPEKLKGHQFEIHTVKIADIPNLKNYTVEKITNDYDGDKEHSERIEKYAKHLKSGGSLPPIVLDTTGRALDGSHRVLAHKAVGIDEVDAFVPVEALKEGKEEKEEWSVTSITGKSDFKTNIPPEERTLKNLPRDSKKKAKVKFKSWLCLKKPEEYRGVSGFDHAWGMAPDGTFYGWSHRALGSFKIGQEITDDTIGNIKGKKTWTIKTAKEALESAISFAKDIA